MSKSLSAQRFLNSDEANEVRVTLQEMMKSPIYNTKSVYSPSAGGEISFCDKHLEYLSQHMSVNVDQYISNLRLMTRVR